MRPLYKFQLQLYLRLDSQNLHFPLLGHPHPKEIFYHQYLWHFFPIQPQLVSAPRTILQIVLHHPNQCKSPDVLSGFAVLLPRSNAQVFYDLCFLQIFHTAN